MMEIWFKFYKNNIRLRGDVNQTLSITINMSGFMLPYGYKITFSIYQVKGGTTICFPWGKKKLFKGKKF